MYVHATSSFICEPIDDLGGLKEELKKYTDYFFRRINKFILLSLRGVHQCVHKLNIDNSTAVYLATENGNLGDTETVLQQLYMENSFPKPFNFINTMSNTASFYVAQSLKSLGRSITVSSKNISFERGLELAKVDFELKHIKEALVGGVDEATTSRHEHIKKYGESSNGVKLVEGSSWLYLKAEKEGALGEVLSIMTFNSRDDALHQVKSLIASGPMVISFGILMTPPEKDIWRKECPHAEEFDYIGNHGYYDTAASFAVCKFFEVYAGKLYVHVNKNIQGQYVAVACKRY
jgi:hypothetical protein